MSVSSIFSSSDSGYDLSQLNVPATSGASSASSTPDLASLLGSSADDTTTGATSGSTSTSVSDKAKLLKQLQQLQQTDPAKFKQVTADIASKLQEEAKQVGGSQGQALSKIADQFQQASQTGTLAPLQAGGHHGHHHAQAASPSTDTSSSASSPSALAAAAYQKSGGQKIGSEVDSIISQVLSQDTASTAGAAS